MATDFTSFQSTIHYFNSNIVGTYVPLLTAGGIFPNTVINPNIIMGQDHKTNSILLNDLDNTTSLVYNSPDTTIRHAKASVKAFTYTPLPFMIGFQTDVFDGSSLFDLNNSVFKEVLNKLNVKFDQMHLYAEETGGMGLLDNPNTKQETSISVNPAIDLEVNTLIESMTNDINFVSRSSYCSQEQITVLLYGDDMLSTLSKPYRDTSIRSRVYSSVGGDMFSFNSLVLPDSRKNENGYIVFYKDNIQRNYAMSPTLFDMHPQPRKSIEYTFAHSNIGMNVIRNNNALHRPVTFTNAVNQTQQLNNTTSNKGSK